MRLFSLIGSVALLIIPFAYTSFSIGEAVTNTSWLALLWFSGEFTFLGISRSGSESFQTSWLENGGTYEAYFGDLYPIGIIILIVLLVNIGLSVIVTERKNKTLPAVILLVCGVVLLILRLLVLGESGLSFYSKSDGIIADTVYFEVPIGFFLSLIFSINDLRQ